MIGKTLSHYRILEHFGAGGMGVVYRARDERLERDVAIKLLPPDALADAGARKRFRKEALALSRINHPNIGCIYDFDSQDGVDFLVLEFVPGETLHDRLARGALPEREITKFGEQLAEGMAAAHQAGVLHRDLKPENVRITPEGRLKILDLGLAGSINPDSTLASTTLTPEGSRIMGTLPYMSPEQVAGRALDERSDLHAMGAVLYEMACGARAFPQASAASALYAVMNEPPPPPRQAGAQITPELERIILKCLEKQPEDRYQSARELAVDLRRLGPRSGAGAPPVRSWTASVTRPRPWVWIAAATAAVAAIVLVVVDPGGLRTRLAGGPDGRGHSLAVLPIANLSGDPGKDYFADGMTDELITRLAQVSALRVISRGSIMGYKGTRKPLRDIARELRVDLVVEGTVSWVGNTLRVSAQLLDATADRHLWADSYQRDVNNVITLQSELVRAVVEKVRVRLTPEERGRLARAREVSPAAHEAYLRGMASVNLYSTAGFRDAIARFSQAVELDPDYAEAYAGLATTYEYMSGMYMSSAEAMSRARAAAQRALALEPDLASAHAALGYVRMNYDWDWAGADSAYRRALELNPSEITVRQNRCLLMIALGRFEEAIDEVARARELDPLSSLVASWSMWPLFEGRRWNQAVETGEGLVAADPGSFSPHMVLGQALLFRGDRLRGIEEIRRSTEIETGYPHPLGWLGHALALAGRRKEAEDVLEKLTRMSDTTYVQPYLFVLVHAGLGNRDAAIGWLEKAIEARSDELVFLGVDPGMDPLREDPRFKALLVRMKFPPRS